MLKTQLMPVLMLEAELVYLNISLFSLYDEKADVKQLTYCIDKYKKKKFFLFFLFYNKLPVSYSVSY